MKHEKIKTIVIFFQLLVILLLTGLLIKKHNNAHEPSNSIILKKKDSPFKFSKIEILIIPSINNTYGYKVIVDGTEMVIQPNRPGLPGNEGFKTKEQAQKVGELVVSKIRNNEVPPTINIEELIKLGVF